MPKKQGDRLNIGEAKASIIRFILENNGPVGEPVIRDFLLQKYDVIDQGNINRHLHGLEKLNCIELIPPEKKGLKNYWDITKLQNLKNIRHEFPELQLNKHEKSIIIVLKEIATYNDTRYWVTYYIKLFISTSFFNTCIELGFEKFEQGIHNIYITTSGSYRHQRINDLLKVCYSACVKYNSDFYMLEKPFTNRMKDAFWELIKFNKDYLSNYFKTYFPGLPEEIPQVIFETKLSEIEEIPEKIPAEINCNELMTYLLNTIYLIIEQAQDYRFSKDDLLLKHFFNHDILLGVDSKDEHYFVKKTIENHAFLSSPISPFSKVINDVALADLKLASEILIKYKQPGRFSYFSRQLDKVYEINTRDDLDPLRKLCI
jgi:hypothetical protein